MKDEHFGVDEYITHEAECLEHMVEDEVQSIAVCFNYHEFENQARINFSCLLDQGQWYLKGQRALPPLFT